MAQNMSQSINITNESDVPLARLRQWGLATDISHRRTGQPPPEVVNNEEDQDQAPVLSPRSPLFEEGQRLWQHSTATAERQTNLIELEEITNVPATASIEVSRLPAPEKVVFSATFSGRVEDDPEMYVNALDVYITKSNIVSQTDRVAVARRGLLNEAKQWADLLKYVPMSYEVWIDRFLDEFNSPRRKAAAYSKFYAESQGDKETSEVFISKKQALLARLHTNMDMATTVEMVILLLRPEIASRIVGNRPLGLEELIKVTRRIEPEVSREYKAMRSDASVRSTSRAAVPLNPCRWCGGQHYDRQCPRNQYNQNREQSHNQGNFQGTGESSLPPNIRTRPIQDVNAERGRVSKGRYYSSGPGRGHPAHEHVNNVVEGLIDQQNLM